MRLNCYHDAMEGRILIIDDDDAVRRVLDRILTGAGYEVEQASDAFQALDLLDAIQPDAALLDIKMPGMDGFGLLDNLGKRGLEIPVVILTGHGDQFTAQECLDAGAAAYLTKPPDRADLLLAVRGAVAQGRVARELDGIDEPPPLLGDSASMRRLREEIARVAPTHATVLVLGESGTGKELVARRLHHLSGRARKPFVRVNCAAIPEELIESELFGHEKGSFTGAHRRQQGKFVQADGGTIFLDEVGDMSLKTQAKVLRVLQDGEVEPVGAGQPFTVDVRVIAATNHDLSAAVADGRFRGELKNVVERAVIMEIDDTIDAVDLFAAPSGGDELQQLLSEPTLQAFQRASEIAFLRHHLAANNWNVAATARAIETPRSNLYKKMQAYGISREDQ